jgi:hypothetical protein
MVKDFFFYCVITKNDFACLLGAISRIIPKEFEEVYIRVYSRTKEQLPVVRSAFLKVSFSHNPH